MQISAMNPMFLLLFLSCSAQALKSNSELCTDSIECNQSVGLYCLQQGSSVVRKCGCPTNDTIFDNQKGRCVGKIGSACIIHEDVSYCPENGICSHQDPLHVGLYYYDSRCFCEANHFLDETTGRCSLAAKYGENCNEQKKCNELSRLTCANGKCDCEFGDDQYFDVTLNKCVSYLNGKCLDFNSCGEGMKCEGIQPVRSRTFNVRDKSDARAPVPVGKCVCEYNFTPTRDRKCLAGYRQSCSASQLCNTEDDLECQDGSCACQMPLHQIYSHNDRRCMKLVGAKCDPKILNGSCIGNSMCNSTTGFCTCIEGYSKTPYRKCMLSWKSPCNPSKHDAATCNVHNGLTCKNGKCACIDETLKYDESSFSCVSLNGMPCGKITTAGDYTGGIPFYVSCQSSHQCVQEPNGDANTLFCRPAS